MQQRLRTPAHYAAVLRGRGRGGAAGRLLVVHMATAHHLADALPEESSGQARVGFVVSKAVGNAVTRNRTKRRLRNLIAGRLGALPAGSAVVVRALPPAGQATSAALAAELDRLLPAAEAKLR